MEWAIFAGFGITFLFITLTSLAVPVIIVIVALRIAKQHGGTIEEDLVQADRNVRESFRLNDDDPEPDWTCPHCGRQNAAHLVECDGCGAPVRTSS